MTNTMVTPNRLRILGLLQDNGGPLAWSELLMDGRSKSAPAWRAMERAGWITANFRSHDWWFDVTNAGRAVLKERGL